MPQLRFGALHSSYYDLGQYTTNYVMAALDGHWDIMFRSHAHPVMLLKAPFLQLLPRVETLLLLQSALLLIGVTLFGRLWTTVTGGDVWAGAGLIMLSISLWSIALFDYHFECFLFPLYVLFFLRLEADGRRVQLELALIAAAICLVKENYALTALGLGVSLIAMRRHIVLGAGIVVGAALYFLLATMYIMPAFSDGRQAGDLWADAFAYLGRTPLEIVTNAVLRPWLLLESGLLSPRKLVFLAAMLVPFAVALWRAPLLLIPALPHVAIMLLSRSDNHSYLANQYTVPIALPLLVATAHAIGSLRRGQPASSPGVAQGFLALACIGSLAVTLTFGLAPMSRLFLTPSIWSFNAGAYIRTKRDQIVEQLINQHVPADRGVAVAMQNTLHVGRLSLRTHAVAFPDGVFEPVRVLRSAAIATHGPAAAATGRNAATRHVDAIAAAMTGAVHVDYVVLDNQRPRYINDRPAPPGSEAASRFDALVRRLPEQFMLTGTYDGVEIWRRGPPAAR